MNPITRDSTFHPTTSVMIEASNKVIRELDLDTWSGEHYDRIENVLSVTFEDDGVHIETTRSHAAWKRGEPNAGRGVRVIPNDAIEAVYA